MMKTARPATNQPTRLLAHRALVTAAIIAIATTTAGAQMTERVAEGNFEVKLTPTSAPDAAVGAMSIAKTFHGDLDGTSVGTMLAVRTPVDGSAGYVAMERVTATLAGHKGSFALQHSGTLTQGAPTLSVSVVPDSGTDGLIGLKGTMDIIISPGRHDYVFRYTLP